MSGNLIRKEKAPWNPLPHMNEYLLELEGQLRSPDYIRKIKCSLGYFSETLREDGISHPDEIERAHVVRHQGWVNEKVTSEEWAKSYAHQQMVYIRGWCNWLEEVQYIEVNPWRRIRLKGYAKEPRPLSDEAIQALFETHRHAAFSMPPFYWHRREVIITLLYGWGLRIHELQAMDSKQFQPNNDFVRITQKGDTKKSLPYIHPIKKVVQRWLRVRSHYGIPEDDALLIDKSGSRLTIRQIRNIVTDLGKDAGVDVNPHRLRDSFGTYSINNGMEVERISKVMGHTKREMTLAYAEVADKAVYDSHERVMGDHLGDLLTEDKR